MRIFFRDFSTIVRPTGENKEFVIEKVIDGPTSIQLKK